MTLKINELPSHWVTVSKPGGPEADGDQLIVLDRTEQRELLEALARVHGFSLEWRRELPVDDVVDVIRSSTDEPRPLTASDLQALLDYIREA